MINYQTITIDLQPDYREPVVQMYLSERDVGRPIQVNVLMQGQPYSFTAGTTVHIDLRKPSGHVVQVNGNYAVGSNVVLFNVVEQMAAEPGMCLTELSIVGDGQDPIGSKNWLTKVELSPMHAGDPSETWIEDLDELVQNAMEGHIDATLSIPGDAADAAAVGEELADLKSALDNIVPGLSEDAKAALLACFDNVAWKGTDGKDYRDALETALAGTPETYSTVLFNDGTLIINEKGSKRAANIENHGSVVSEYPALDESHTYNFTVNTSDFSSTAYWYANRANINRVEVGAPIKPARIQGWFCGLSNCVSMSISNLDVSNVSNARYAFYGCSSLVSLNTSRFVFSSKLSDALGIFRGCSSLERIDLSASDFSHVYTITDLFNGCSSLQSVILPDLSKTGETDADLTGTMFVFKDCSNLVSISDLTKFNTSKSNSLRGFFDGCARLTEVNISRFESTLIANTVEMFRNCTMLRTIYASANFNTSTNTNSANMFTGCTNLVGGSGTVYNANYVNKTRARIDGGTSSPGYFTAAA